jgi:hypothetical protein
MCRRRAGEESYDGLLFFSEAEETAFRGKEFKNTKQKTHQTHKKIITTTHHKTKTKTHHEERRT